MIRRFLLLDCIVFLICIGCAGVTKAQPSLSDTSANGITTEALAEQKSSQETTVSNAATNTFAPTFKSDEEDKYYDAMEIYESSPSAPQGVYDYQGLVYVIVVIDTKTENIQYREGTALLRVKALLQMSFPSLPKNFRLRNRVVENELDDDGFFRYAVVFRQSDIKKLIK